MMLEIPEQESLFSISQNPLQTFLQKLIEQMDNQNEKLIELYEMNRLNEKRTDDHEGTIVWMRKWKEEQGDVNLNQIDGEILKHNKNIETIGSELKDIQDSQKKMQNKIDNTKDEIIKIMEGNAEDFKGQLKQNDQKLMDQVDNNLSGLQEQNNIQDRKSDELQGRVVEVASSQSKQAQKIKALSAELRKIRDDQDAIDLTKFIQKKEFNDELKKFDNLVNEIRLASDEKYLFKAVQKEFTDDIMDKNKRLRLTTEEHFTQIQILDKDLKDLTKKVLEQKLAKADANQVNQLMERINMFKNQLEDQKDTIAEMSKSLNIREDVSLLKTRVEQCQKSLGTKMDSKFKDEFRSGLIHVNKEVQDTKQEIKSISDELKSSKIDIKKILEKLTYLDIEKLSKDDFKQLKQSVEEQINTQNGELDELRTYFNSKLFLKADKEWVKSVMNKMKSMIARTELNQRERDEALISKKPIENAKCGSCEAQLEELKGVKADQVKWNRMPTDSSNLKISNMGKGQSRMINFMKKQDGDSDDEVERIQKAQGLSDRPLRNISNVKVRPQSRTETDRPKTRVDLTPMSPRIKNNHNEDILTTEE